MNYEKLSGSIRAVIDRRPGDNGAYSDLFSLCREWETEDFSAAHKMNKELLALSADQVVRGGGAKFYEQWRRCLLFEAPHDFDSFMTYIELDRKPEKRFYAPRKHYLRPMVQGFQDVLDGKLRLLTISMPKRAGKSQTGMVGWEIPAEYVDIFSNLVIIGAVLMVSCKYITEAFTKFKAILDATKEDKSYDEVK